MTRFRPSSDSYVVHILPISPLALVISSFVMTDYRRIQVIFKIRFSSLYNTSHPINVGVNANNNYISGSHEAQSPHQLHSLSLSNRVGHEEIASKNGK
jgi:glucan phosphoethanolaminetransferase (alkaline phosphatase superfamily)